MPLLAGSPDAVASVREQEGSSHIASIEIKTMAALATIENARRTRAKYSAHVIIQNIGEATAALHAFHDLVPTTAYRLQCLHHAAVLDKPRVLFVVSKGSRLGVGEIIYCAHLVFSEKLLASYKFCLTAILLSCFEWIGKKAKEIPKEYDELLGNTHAVDIFSFVSFYNVSKAYKCLATNRGPLPLARMIRPTSVIYWNHVKGGVDEFSRTLKVLSYQNTSENPIVSVLGRLICAQINNAAVVYRLSVAKGRGLLLENNACEREMRKGYVAMRHDVARCCTFSSFARLLAKEFLATNIQSPTEEQTSTTITKENLKPMYMRNAVMKYNRPPDRERRLSHYSSHKRVMAKDGYCSLCSFNFKVKLNGKMFKKKGGARMRQWCSVCMQQICSSCWEDWHSLVTLERATISPSQRAAFMEKIQSQNGIVGE